MTRQCKYLQVRDPMGRAALFVISFFVMPSWTPVRLERLQPPVARDCSLHQDRTKENQSLIILLSTFQNPQRAIQSRGARTHSNESSQHPSAISTLLQP